MDLQYVANIASKKKDEAIMTIEIDISIANLYKGDMDGLLRKHLNVDSKLVPYNITLNGFNSSSDYNGEIKILLLKDNFALRYL